MAMDSKESGDVGGYELECNSGARTKLYCHNVIAVGHILGKSKSLRLESKKEICENTFILLN